MQCIDIRVLYSLKISFGFAISHQNLWSVRLWLKQNECYWKCLQNIWDKNIYIDFIKKSKYDYWININTLITIPLVFIGTVIMEMHIMMHTNCLWSLWCRFYWKHNCWPNHSQRHNFVENSNVTRENNYLNVFFGGGFGIIRTIKKIVLCNEQ